MLQIFATIFFSMATLASMAMIAAALLDNWRDVSAALGLGEAGGGVPRLAPGRINRARSPRPTPLPARPLRAAA